MATHGYVGHETPDGELPFERYGACSADGYAGENVASTWYDRNIVHEEGEVPAAHLSDEEEVAAHLVESWMASETHRETLLGENWERIGVGVDVAEDNEVFAAQAFCSGSLSDTD